MIKPKFPTDAETTAWENGFEYGKEIALNGIRNVLEQEASALLKEFNVRLEGSAKSHDVDKRIIQFLKKLTE